MDRRRSKLAVGSMGALMLAAMTACDGTDPIPFAQLAASIDQAACRVDVLCGDFPDQATCLTSRQDAPHYYDTLGEDVDAGTVVYDGGKARACVDLLSSLSYCSRIGPSTLSSDPNCTGIFSGTVAAGGACFFRQECAGGGLCEFTDTSCESSAQCCPGTCVAVPPPTASGEPCPQSPATCASDVCVIGPSGTATCQDTVGLGASCSGDIPCGPRLYCDPVSWICKAPVATGGACFGSQDCGGTNDRCDATTSVCTPLLPVGTACDPTSGGCVTYAACDATTSTCVELPLVGASCDPVNGPSCLGGTCDATSGTCMLMPTAGACS